MNRLIAALATGLGLVVSTPCFAQQQVHFTNPGGADPDSFGNSLIYLGVGFTGSVVFGPVCDSEVVPPDVCVVVPSDGSATTFELLDLGSMVIPKGATRTTIWPMMINRYNINFRESNGVTSRGVFFGNVIIAIESAVLNDPAIIDPTTGLPANGRLLFRFPETVGIDRQLAPGELYRFRIRADGSGIGAFSTSTLMGNTGLSAQQVKKLFAEPLTLRFGLSGTVRNAGGSMFVGFRLMGDR